MSVSVMRAVFAADIRPAATKLMALALADYSDDEGGRIFPSMSTIAAKVGVTRSQAQRQVHRLVELGILEVTSDGTGGGRGKSTHYRMRLDQLVARSGNGSTHAAVSLEKGPHGCSEKGRIAAAKGPHACTESAARMRPEQLRTTIDPPMEPTRALARAGKRRELTFRQVDQLDAEARFARWTGRSPRSGSTPFDVVDVDARRLEDDDE